MTRGACHLIGDEDQLFRELHPPLVRRLTGALGGDRHAAEDACASTWAIFLRRQPERSPRLRGWLWTTAWHEAAAERGRTSREQPAQVDHHFGGCDPLDLVLDAEHFGRVLQGIASVSDTQREALTLLATGLTYDEIGSVMGCNWRQINRYLVKGRARLRHLAAG